LRRFCVCPANFQSITRVLLELLDENRLNAFEVSGDGSVAEIRGTRTNAFEVACTKAVAMLFTPSSSLRKVLEMPVIGEPDSDC